MLVSALQNEPLDPVEVGDPVRCDLGKWIASMIDSHQCDSLLDALITIHAEFHKVASAIVSLANSGEREAAKRLLDDDLAELSADVVDLLNEISIRSQPKNS